MIIDDLYVRWAFCRLWPFKAYSPLLIDPDRKLASPIALQRFESIAWEARKVSQGQRRIEYFKPLPSLAIKALNARTNSPFAKSSVRLSLKPKIIVMKFSCLYDVRQT